MRGLQGKNAIITGGAKGIGKGVARRLASEGTHVVIADILAEEGLSVVIIKANTNVMVDGTICYVSTANVTVTDKDTISIYDEENTSLSTDVCTYIIYK